MGPLVMLQDFTLCVDGYTRECIAGQVVPWVPEVEAQRLIKAGIAGRFVQPVKDQPQKDGRYDRPRI